jgi:hypothetical protein
MKKYTIVLGIALLAGIIASGYCTTETEQKRIISNYDDLTIGQKKAINRRILILLHNLKRQLNSFIKDRRNQEKMSTASFNELRNLKLQIKKLKEKYNQEIDKLETPE